MKARERGVALVTAILIVAIIAALATSLALGQQIWLRHTQNLVDQAQAERVRQGALEFAAVILARDARNSRTRASDHLGEEWAETIPPLPVEGGVVVISIADAQARFNLNNLAGQGSPTSPPTNQATGDIAIFRHLLVQNELSPDLVDALRDWIDNDQIVQGSGAEDLDYLNLDPPYRAANRPLTSVDELRLIKGFTPEAVEKLREHVVALPTKTPINVNTASAAVLAALTQSNTTLGEQIAKARADQPFKNPAEFQTLLGQNANVGAGGYDVKSGYFIVSVATRIGRTQRITEALIERPLGGNQKAQALWHRQPAFQIVLDEDNS